MLLMALTYIQPTQTYVPRITAQDVGRRRRRFSKLNKVINNFVWGDTRRVELSHLFYLCDDCAGIVTHSIVMFYLAVYLQRCCAHFCELNSRLRKLSRK